MRVSLDLDGVLYPWHQIIWEKYFSMREGYKNYRFFWQEMYKHVNKSEFESLLSDESNYMYASRADIVMMVHKIALSNMVFYVSQRPPSMGKATKRWLVLNGFPAATELYLTNDKVYVCNKLEVDLHVEDRIDVMHDLSDNGIRVLGVKQPWNERHINDFQHVDDVMLLEREIARINSSMKVNRRRNGNE